MVRPVAQITTIEREFVTHGFQEEGQSSYAESQEKHQGGSNAPTSVAPRLGSRESLESRLDCSGPQTF